MVAEKKLFSGTLPRCRYDAVSLDGLWEWTSGLDTGLRV